MNKITQLTAHLRLMHQRGQIVTDSDDFVTSLNHIDIAAKETEETISDLQDHLSSRDEELNAVTKFTEAEQLAIEWYKINKLEAVKYLMKENKWGLKVTADYLKSNSQTHQIDISATTTEDVEKLAAEMYPHNGLARPTYERAAFIAGHNARSGGKWVQIKSEKDLPKPTANHDTFAVDRNGKIEVVSSYLLKFAYSRNTWVNAYTHFMPITKPQPPTP